MDPQSVEMFGKDPECEKFFQNQKDLWTNTERLSDVLKRVDEFDAVYYVGGHGRKCNGRCASYCDTSGIACSLMFK